MIFSAPCPTCMKYRTVKGLVTTYDKHGYWQCLLPDGKWHHKTRFGKAFHKMALKYFEDIAP